jgi:aminoglycoside phosphotransferase family enzyme/predicted kinase
MHHGACDRGRPLLPAPLEGLLRAQAYPHPVTHIELLETQLSWILITGERTYKLKRAVQYPFVDQRELADRLRLCLEELRLNRRFTPQLYLDVQPVTVLNGAAQIGGSGLPIEYVVVMRSFDREEQLDQLVLNGRLRDGELAAFGGWLARTHRKITSARNAHPPLRPAQLLSAMRRNAEEAITASAHFGTGPSIAELARQLAKEVGLRDPELLHRADAGLMGECHADLHLSNVVRLDGALWPFDCLEFDAELRWIDPAQDLAFLYADLLGYDATHFANELLNAYLAESGDYHATTVLPLYTADRALVRAKVMALQARYARGLAPERAALLRLRHGRYLCVARSALQAPVPQCVAMTGLPGSGKSWIAARLGRRLGAVVVRSDRERKRLAGLDALAPSHSGTKANLYDEQHTEAVYHQLMRHAADVLSGHQSLVIDANFSKRRQRAMIASFCRFRGYPLTFVECAAPTAMLRRRIAEREAAAQDPSEADLSILELQAAEREPIADNECLRVVRVDTTRDDALASVLGGLTPGTPNAPLPPVQHQSVRPPAA